MRAFILCYHKVGPVAQEGRRLNIEPHRLESHVRYFSRRSFSFLLARDLAKPWPARTACFTFDDAYLSTMANAPPVLEKFSAKGSFYAVPSKVGIASDWDGDLARPLASWHLLRDVQARGHEIGNHTLSHVLLEKRSPQEQLKELVDADQWLRQEGLDPGSFCFPYGSLNDSAIAAVRQAGYSVGLALRKRIATSDEDLLALSRVVVAYSDSLPALLYRLHVRPLLRRR